MRVVPMFRASVLTPLVRYVEQVDGRAARMFGRTFTLLRDPKALIPLSTGGEVFDRAARAFGLPELGLLVAEGIRIDRVAAFAAFLRGAQTLGDALQRVVCLGSRLNTGQRYRLEIRGDEVHLHRWYARSLVEGRTPLSDFALVVTLQLLRLAAASPGRPTEIHFEGPPPEHAERLAALAERRVFFDSPQSTVVFPQHLLALALPEPASSYTADRDGIRPSSDPLTSLRQTIEAMLRMGSVDVRAAALAAGLSVRSFQRRLAEVGLRFGDLLDQQRFRLAREMLAHSDMRVIDVGMSLGYSDSANFTRAFRRWASIPPQDFRIASMRNGDVRSA